MHMHKSLTFFLVLLLVHLGNSAYGAAAGNLYQAIVPVKTRLEQERQTILPEAFEQVLVKLTGNLQVGENRLLAQQLPQAVRYVQKYYYSNSIYPGHDLLFVTFEPKSVDELLSAAQLPKWTARRPLLLIWLIKDEDGKKSIVDDADPMATDLKLAASQMGLAIMFPAYDLEDMQQVSMDDIWAPNVASIVKCAQRYGADKLLIGRVVQGPQQDWYAQWQIGNGLSWHSLSHDEESSSKNPSAVMQQTMRQVLLELAQIDELPAGDKAQAKPLLNIRLNVNGVTGLVDYQRVLEYLQQLPGVVSVQVLNVGADQIALNLGVQMTQESLIQEIAQTKLLAAETTHEQNVLEYELQS